MNPPLTERQIQDILRRNPGNIDVRRMDAELTRLADQLADCWLLLDMIAKGGGAWAEQAASLLVRQWAPGYKSGNGPLSSLRETVRDLERKLGELAGVVLAEKGASP